ncbi:MULTISPECIES: flavodoxin family protein [unclassified Sedimentibacter]|uniref:flavodoxin family protein n=1 Tax=unclassified Sedimentibacter TaxID=2649220 RepID=UPI0027E04470|nr:flavodoxin [Sedimentibacter sp. MB35-C1]WMJ78891.1 flavodoxin [Sedimentibacter sp. MB35-C1]
MKNLVVYYSRSGNTKIVAEEISKIIECELEKIEFLNDIGSVRAAFTSLIGCKARIKHLNIDPKKYDNIFIGCPVWAGKSATPMNTFLNNFDFTNKNVFIFITQADSKTPVKVYESISKRVADKGGNVADMFFVQTNMKSLISSQQAMEAATEWINKLRLK